MVWIRVTYAGIDIQKIEGLIRSCLPLPQKLYNVTKRLKTKDEVEQYFPGFMTFTDCSAEQPIPRPKNWIRMKIYYSGKKKKHTCQESVYSKPKGSDSLQDKAQSNG